MPCCQLHQTLKVWKPKALLRNLVYEAHPRLFDRSVKVQLVLDGGHAARAVWIMEMLGQELDDPAPASVVFRPRDRPHDV